MHDMSHATLRLAVHLPDEQAVHFQLGKDQESLEGASSKETTLTACFKLNQTRTIGDAISLYGNSRPLCFSRQDIPFIATKNQIL